MNSSETVENIPLEKLKPFPNHPFQVRDDAPMRQLVESIRQVGVLVPIIVRHTEDQSFEIISGHRRTKACEVLAHTTIPAIIRDVDSSEAVIMMVDSNFQREQILPSEKAKAYKMKLDALKCQGARTDLTSDHAGQKLEKKSTRDMIAVESPDSSTQIQRFVRLNELVPELMDMVDLGRVALTPAVELSYLSEEEQNLVAITIESEQAAPSLSQAQRMRKLSKAGALEDDTILNILCEKKKPECWNLAIPMNKISKYFPITYTPMQMQHVIIQLLEQWLLARKKKEEEIIRRSSK